MCEALFNNKNFGAAMIQNVIEIIRHQSKIEWHQDRAQQRSSKECFQNPMTNLREYGNSIAFGYAETPHRVGPSVDALAEFSISQPRVATHHRLLCRVSYECSFQKIIF